MQRQNARTPLRVGIIGTGWVAQDRHIPSVMADHRATVVGVADRNVDRAAQIARRFDIPHVANHPEALFDLGLDAVIVCTPPDSHYGLVSEAMARGVHVLVEKPLTVGHPAAERLLAQYATAGVKAGVSHNFLGSRSARQALERIRSGAAGKVLSVRGMQLSSEGRRLPKWYPGLPGGLFYDEAPHLFYLVRAFAGELSVASARVWDVDRNRPQPIGHLEALFDGRVAPAHITMNFRAPVSEWLVIVTCSERVLLIDLFRDNFLEMRSDGGHGGLDILRSSSSLWTQQVVQFAKSGALYASGRLRYGHERLVRAFVDSVVTDAPEPVSLSDGARVVGLMDQVLETAGFSPEPRVESQQLSRAPRVLVGA